MNKYKILVKNLGGVVLTFDVNEFSYDNGFVVFIDLKTNIRKRYHISTCEIHEVLE